MKFWFRSAVLGAAAVLSFTGLGSASERVFGPFRWDSIEPQVIELRGEIDSGAALNFRRALSAAPQANLLRLNSPGGLVTIALLIADDVDQRRMSTIIPPGAECYSACSFIFLAGVDRVAAGRLGVHQISQNSPDLQSAQLAISDILDVLNRFSTPTEVLTVMFRTPPDQMYVFTPQEIAALGINRVAEERTLRSRGRQAVADIAPTPSTLPGDRPARGADSLPAADLEGSSRRFLEQYLAAWSGGNDEALAFMREAYADAVTFYGKPVTGSAVLEEKRKFAARWPTRLYTLRPDSVRVRCTEQSCLVGSLVDWYAHSDARGKTSRGAAELNLEWDPVSGMIVSESGRVVKDPVAGNR